MPDPARDAVRLAESLLRSSLGERTMRERWRAAQLAGLIADPRAKQLSMAIADRAMRTSDPRRAAEIFRSVLDRVGHPRGLGALRNSLLAIAKTSSHLVPQIVIAGVRRQLRAESREVILSADDDPLSAYLRDRGSIGWRVNLNLLGEAILGEEDAAARREAILRLLQRTDVDYVSVKISALFSQINLIAWKRSIESIKDALRPIYRAALRSGKFVNLDMEEYRDLALTMDAFCSLLDEPEFHSLSAGMVLQSYLPDSWDALQSLTEWAQTRIAKGGARIKVRLVKGANLAVEQLEATLHGWRSAPYSSKQETDANFKRMLDFAARPEHVAAVRIGVASHNLFDVALALTLRDQRGVADAIEIEMLEGMANHQARAVRDAAGGLLVYSPIVPPEQFETALAYLVRRLDENTAPDNFLSHLFDLTPGSDAWAEQEQRFVRAWSERDAVSATSRRTTLPAEPAKGFFNAPDTDWTQRRHRESLYAAIDAYRPEPLPAVPSLEEIYAAARRAQPAWEAIGEAGRATVLRKCADVLESNRFQTIALLNDEGKKAIAEADAEVSEAIDFARYYAEIGQSPVGVDSRALGTVVVAPPWNFPFAIPCGGVLAALMAGNAVVLKPAPETRRIAHQLVRLLWQAGVPRETLQFVPCDDGDLSKSLITDPRTAAVVLTGGYDTARLFQSWRPALRLYAETSGKNAIVVSAIADRDLAVKDIVRSAFGHSGQKCSAASLAILEAEVYDDPVFRRQLRDAAASLPVGQATELTSIVTPLIREPGEALRRGLTTLDLGEWWLLEPRQIGDDPCLWSPGIRMGVEPGSWFHQTECFGPVLGVMRARNLDHATDLQNAVAFGLTAGFHSLDEAEIEQWIDRVQAGNLYVNRTITGAIVRRQPFGGWKRSSIGPGAKAGGPNYVSLFRRYDDRSSATLPEIRSRFENAWHNHFAQPHDPSGLRIEQNTFRYRPARGVLVRLSSEDATREMEIARLASAVTGTPMRFSDPKHESDEQFIRRLPELTAHAEFLRTTRTPSDALLSACHAAGLNWIDAPFSGVPSIELPRWLREQSVTNTRHRYGNPLDGNPLDA